jgi:hypothetical protein
MQNVDLRKSTDTFTSGLFKANAMPVAGRTVSIVDKRDPAAV